MSPRLRWPDRWQAHPDRDLAMRNLNEAIETLREAIATQEASNESLRRVVARLGPRR